MRKRLPHHHADGLIQHVVFCTRDAFAAPVADAPDRLEVADRAPDDSLSGRILVGAQADVVRDTLLFGVPAQYVLHAWCVMPNHVHALVEPNKEQALKDVVQRWKSISARTINKTMMRHGPVWQANYFDRFMRDEAQVEATIDYIELNPVAAGLVEHAAAWRWSSAYVGEE